MADVDLSESRAGALIGTSVALLVLTWMSISVRVYVRAILTKSFRIDDFSMVLGQIIFTIICSFVLKGAASGLGRHHHALEESQIIEALKWQALAVTLYILDMMFIKLSIGIFLLRLSVETIYQWILWISLFVIGIWSMVLFLWNLFHCIPIEAQWDFTIVNVRCTGPQSIVHAAYAHSAMTIASDWLYALLPIPMVWRVKMTRQEKATVIFVLGLGIFASIATLFRLKYLTDLGKTSDLLYNGTDAMVWTLIEPGIAITAACLATIRPLLRRWRLAGFESSYLRSDRSGEPSTSSATYANSSSHPPHQLFMPPPPRTLAAHSTPGDLTLIDLECGSDVSAGATRHTSLRSLPGTAESERPLRGDMFRVTRDSQEPVATADETVRGRHSGANRFLELPGRRKSNIVKSDAYVIEGTTFGDGNSGSGSNSGGNSGSGTDRRTRSWAGEVRPTGQDNV